MTPFVILGSIHLTILFLGVLSSAELKTRSSEINPAILHGLRIWAAEGEEEFEESSVPGGNDEDHPLKLRLFSDEQAEAFGARTLDGSPSGYYYRAGSENDSFVIHLDGGGLCINEKDCKHRANTTKGTSTKWLPNSTDGAGMLSSNTSFNPFGNWNHIRVPYGSGDVYIGTHSVPNSDGLYFAGHNTLEAIVSDLKNRSGLATARRVLFTGVSAGGIGVFQNADWLGSQLSAATLYKAAPQAGGYFTNSFLKIMPQYVSGLFNGSSNDPSVDPLIDAVSWMADYLVTFYGGTTGPHAVHMDHSCMEAQPLLEKHTCWSAAVHYPYIETPLFVAQNRFDSNQAGSVLGLNWWPYPEDNKTHALAEKAYIRYFGRRTASGIATNVTRGPKNGTDGLFMPSCFTHGWNFCMRRNASVVKGVRYPVALEDWFWGRGKVPHLLLDDCNDRLGTDDPCNSNCGCYGY